MGSNASQVLLLNVAVLQWLGGGAKRVQKGRQDLDLKRQQSEASAPLYSGWKVYSLSFRKECLPLSSALYSMALRAEIQKLLLGYSKGSYNPVCGST